MIIFEWSEGKKRQYAELSAQPCPNEDFYGLDTIATGTYVKHGLQAVTARSWRDWFRQRQYWRCHFCDLRERMVE